MDSSFWIWSLRSASSSSSSSLLSDSLSLLVSETTEDSLSQPSLPEFGWSAYDFSRNSACSNKQTSKMKSGKSMAIFDVLLASSF